MQLSLQPWKTTQGSMNFPTFTSLHRVFFFFAHDALRSFFFSLSKPHPFCQFLFRCSSAYEDVPGTSLLTQSSSQAEGLLSTQYSHSTLFTLPAVSHSTLLSP